MILRFIMRIRCLWFGHKWGKRNNLGWTTGTGKLIVEEGGRVRPFIGRMYYRRCKICDKAKSH